MKNEEIYRDLFIKNTIRLVSEGGFEAATTSAIAGERREIDNIRVNEAHIYRIFGTKAHLFAEVFSILDCELLAAAGRGLEKFDKETDKRKQWEILFREMWDLFMEDESGCRYYVRYYYSAYFKGESLRAHNAKFKEFICDMTPLFVESADVCAILQHVVTVILGFAVCVFNKSIPNDEDNRSHVFNVVYASINPYLK